MDVFIRTKKDFSERFSVISKAVHLIRGLHLLCRNCTSQSTVPKAAPPL